MHCEVTQGGGLGRDTSGSLETCDEVVYVRITSSSVIVIQKEVPSHHSWIRNLPERGLKCISPDI